MIDMRAFKKTAEDRDTATLTHEKGHTVTISKAGLSKDLLKQLGKLPLHQNQPQDVVADPRQESITDPAQSAMTVLQRDDIPANQDANQPTSGDVPVQAPTSEVQAANDSIGTPESMAQQDPSQAPAQDPMQGLQGYAEGKEGIRGQAAALDQEGQDVKGITDSSVSQQTSDKHSLEKQLRDDMTEVHNATQDVKNGQIKPNQYLDNLGTGGKIATAIGLILGGAGGGIAGTENPALKFLQSQIDRNLDAQKANLGSKENLLSALQNKYKDHVVAGNMFRLINANIVADQIKSAMANSQSAQAQAAGHTAISNLEKAYVPLALQVSLANYKNGITNGPQGGEDFDGKVQTYLKAADVSDPKAAAEMRKRYIPGVGIAQVDLTDKDRDLFQKKTELKGLLDRAQVSLQGAGRGIGYIPGTDKYYEAQSLQKQINLRMGELAGLTRFTPEENKIYTQTVPDITGTHFTARDFQLLKGLMDTNNTSLNSFYQQKGIKKSWGATIQAGADDKITVINPKGVSGQIPRSQLGQAIKSGYKQAGG